MPHVFLARTNLSDLPVAVLVGLGLLALLEAGLDVFALVDLYRRPRERVVTGNKWIWVAIIVLVNLLGAILYLAIGRQAPPAAEPPAAAGEGHQQRIEGIVDSLYGPADRQERA